MRRVSRRMPSSSLTVRHCGSWALATIDHAAGNRARHARYRRMSREADRAWCATRLRNEVMARLPAREPLRGFHASAVTGSRQLAVLPAMPGVEVGGVAGSRRKRHFRRSRCRASCACGNCVASSEQRAAGGGLLHRAPCGCRNDLAACRLQRGGMGTERHPLDSGPTCRADHALQLRPPADLGDRVPPRTCLLRGKRPRVPVMGSAACYRFARRWPMSQRHLDRKDRARRRILRGALDGGGSRTGARHGERPGRWRDGRSIRV